MRPPTLSPDLPALIIDNAFAFDMKTPS